MHAKRGKSGKNIPRRVRRASVANPAAPLTSASPDRVQRIRQPHGSTRRSRILRSRTPQERLLRATAATSDRERASRLAVLQTSPPDLPVLAVDPSKGAPAQQGAGPPETPEGQSRTHSQSPVHLSVPNAAVMSTKERKPLCLQEAPQIQPSSVVSLEPQEWGLWRQGRHSDSGFTRGLRPAL